MTRLRTGTGDCERCRSHVFAQPANTASSLGLVVAGAELLRNRQRDVPIEVGIAWSAIAAGLGSVAFHGPGGRLSQVAHDGGLIALLASVATADLAAVAGWRPGAAVSATIAVSGLVVAATRWSGPAQIVVGTVAVCGEIDRVKRAPRPPQPADRALGPVALSGAAAHVLGRTGGPLCRPDSVVQPHAYWHLATATAVWLRGRSVRRTRPRDAQLESQPGRHA